MVSLLLRRRSLILIPILNAPLSPLGVVHVGYSGHFFLLTINFLVVQACYKLKYKCFKNLKKNLNKTLSIPSAVRDARDEIGTGPIPNHLVPEKILGLKCGNQDRTVSTCWLSSVGFCWFLVVTAQMPCK